MKLIQLISALTMTLFAASAAAEISYEVSLNSLDVKKGIMNFSYSTGGGCQEHTPKVVVSIEEGEKLGTLVTHNAVIKVLDTVPERDACEAIIHVDGQVDLEKVIKAEMEKQGDKPGLYKFNVYKIELPKLSIWGNLYK